MQRSTSTFRIVASGALRCPPPSSSSLLLFRPFSSSSPSSSPLHHAHCVDLVKAASPSSYHIGLLLPSQKAKRSYFALKGFELNIEAFKLNLRDVHETMPTRMKFQWWRDRIEDMYEGRGDTPQIYNNPVAGEVRWAIEGKGFVVLEWARLSCFWISFVLQ
jgi:hypothetical protein